MTLIPSYSNLKEQVIFNVGIHDNQGNLLDHLKEFYKGEIDSNRRFEQIKTIGQLLRILEIRDVLSEDNIAPLKEIATRINNKELLKKINDYEISHVHGEVLNLYGNLLVYSYESLITAVAETELSIVLVQSVWHFQI